MRLVTVAEALERLRAQGGRVTPQRRALMELLARARRPMSAPELVETLRRQFPDMAADTVYRNLQGLVTLGAVEVFHMPEGADRFEWVTYHHHHAVCLDCGEVLCLEPCQEEQMPQAPAGFRPVRHEFQIFGYCEGCASETGGTEVPAR